MSMKEFWSTDLSWWCSSQRQVFPSPPPSSPPPPRCAGQTFKWSGFQILILWRPKLMCSAFKRWEKAMYHILAAHPLMLGLPFCFKFCLHPLLYFPSPLLFIFLPRFFFIFLSCFFIGSPAYARASQTLLFSNTLLLLRLHLYILLLTLVHLLWSRNNEKMRKPGIAVVLAGLSHLPVPTTHMMVRVMRMLRAPCAGCIWQSPGEGTFAWIEKTSYRLSFYNLP